ncbi:MAG: hypothetical protein MHM6MM_005989 [Cercozoa sp. M6MM]
MRVLTLVLLAVATGVTAVYDNYSVACCMPYHFSQHAAPVLRVMQTYQPALRTQTADAPAFMHQVTSTGFAGPKRTFIGGQDKDAGNARLFQKTSSVSQSGDKASRQGGAVTRAAQLRVQYQQLLAETGHGDTPSSRKHANLLAQRLVGYSLANKELLVPSQQPNATLRQEARLFEETVRQAKLRLKSQNKSF